MPDSDIQREKDEISRQQYWYAMSTLAFIVLVANIIKPISRTEFWISAPMVALSICSGIFMVIVCHREYLRRDNREMGWWRAFGHSFIEVRGAFFCNALIFIEGAGVILLSLSRISWIVCSH